MLSKIKYLISEYRFYFISIIFLLALLIYYRYEILVIEKKRVEIDKELYQLQVKSERRQKAYDEKVEQQQAKLERRLEEIKKELD